MPGTSPGRRCRWMGGFWLREEAGTDGAAPHVRHRPLVVRSSRPRRLAIMRDPARKRYRGRLRVDDLVIRNATIVDGTGGPARSGDVVTDEGEITDATSSGASPAKTRGVIDAKGDFLAAGFVHIQTPYGGQVCWDKHVTATNWHRVIVHIMPTTGCVVTPCGAPQHPASGHNRPDAPRPRQHGRQATDVQDREGRRLLRRQGTNKRADKKLNASRASWADGDY